ncbi:hypothetical protein MTR_1g071050 [Medicago truncatula]|uniref:Uncharacterized protein n=1 Tax=Medicago truncatula TaxID=3880 RepID=G7ICP4_MEDTR|nr:hypothetical protein MTR_1g071050 [Medicago truncatula]
MPDFLNFCALKDVSLGWIEVHIDTLKNQTSLSAVKIRKFGISKPHEYNFSD